MRERCDHGLVRQCPDCGGAQCRLCKAPVPGPFAFLDAYSCSCTEMEKFGLSLSEVIEAFEPQMPRPR
jgi:hypothetical protein